MGSEAPESLALRWVSPWVLRAVECQAEYRVLLPLPRVVPRTMASFPGKNPFCFQPSLPDSLDYAGFFYSVSERHMLSTSGVHPLPQFRIGHSFDTEPAFLVFYIADH